MRVITVLWEDSLSVRMFVDFYRSIYTSKDPYVVKLNSLYSSEVITSLVAAALSLDEPEVIFTYKVKPETDNSLIPIELLDASTVSFRLARFSSTPERIKVNDYGEEVIKRWEANIERMDKTF